MAEKAGYFVLRLSHIICVLSPIEMVGNQCKENISTENRLNYINHVIKEDQKKKNSFHGPYIS